MKSESKIIQNTSTTITMHTTNKNNYITLKEHMSKQETKQKDDNAIYLVATKAIQYNTVQYNTTKYNI